MHFSTDFKSIFLFQKNPAFRRQVSTSIFILTPPLSRTSPSISEIPLHHTSGLRSQPLNCISEFEKLSKDMWPKRLALVFRVRCWDAFLVLWNSTKVTTTSTMQSVYTFILSVWKRLLKFCISTSNLHTIILNIYSANRNLLIGQFL